MLLRCVFCAAHSSGLIRTTRVVEPGVPVAVPSRLALALRGVCWRSTLCISAQVRPCGGVAAGMEDGAGAVGG